MTIKDFLYNWVVPRGFINIYKELTSTNVTKKRRANNDDNLIFKNIHKGQRCFILASGPSINEMDLLPLQNENCIAVSSFFHHKDINTIRPKYHVLAPLHPPFDFNEAEIVFNGLEKNYNYSIDLFVGTNAFPYSYIEYIKMKPTKHIVHPINYQYSPQLNDKNRDDESVWDITQNPFSVRTVVFSAIQIAVYMGFKEIYLLGCDHDFLQRIGQYEGRHFYESSKSFSDEKHLKQFNLEKMFLGHYNTWSAYRNMKEHLEPKGIKIYNASKKSMLDVFERVDLDSIIS